ncbi:MAG: nitronate monooxygenase [Mycobacteriaceae bacterium]
MSAVLDGLAVPVIAAPMAGGPSTPELVRAVSGAGGLGLLGGALLTVDGLAAEVDAAGIELPFGVNLFMPTAESAVDLTGHLAALDAWADRFGVQRGEPRYDDDQYPAKLTWLTAHAVPVVSFTFGCPDAATVAALQAAGSEVWVTVTRVADAVAAEAAGADALCVQGPEAGGHRSTFTNAGEPEAVGLLALLRMVQDAVDLPLVAAGGLINGADVAAVLVAGARAAQLGTAFLRCPEAGTTALHRAAVASATETAITRAFSGRPARGVRNAMLDELSAAAPAAYPQLHHASKPVRAASAAAGDGSAMSLWAGQTHSLSREMPAAELVRTLLTEARHALRSVQLD